MRRRLLLPAAVAALIAGCGGSPGDLLALDVTGGPTGARQHIVIRNDGLASCNGGKERDIGSPALIDAREVERDMGKLADRAATFHAAPGATGFRSYAVRGKSGTVRWDETARGLPPVLPRAQLLALQLGRKLC
jgi:hypothetical protein